MVPIISYSVHSINHCFEPDLIKEETKILLKKNQLSFYIFF